MELKVLSFNRSTNMGKIKLLIVFVIAFYIIFPSGLSAELSTAQFEIIKIAYVNGYASALKTDLEIIKALKEDQAQLKKHAQAAVNGYMAKVSVLNKDEMASGNKNKKSISSYSSLPL